MKRYLLCAALTFSYLTMYGTTAKDEVIKAIEDFVYHTNFVYYRRAIDPTKHKTDADKMDRIQKTFSALEKEEKNEVLQTLSEMQSTLYKKDYEKYRYCPLEFVAAALAVFSLENAIYTYYTHPAGSWSMLRSVLSSLGAQIGVLGTYACSLFVQTGREEAKKRGDNLERGFVTVIGSLIATPFALAAATSLLATTATITGCNNEPNAGKKTIGHLAAMAACLGACAYGTNYRYKCYAQWSRADYLYNQLSLLYNESSSATNEIVTRINE